jgi:hypothetical protein
MISLISARYALIVVDEPEAFLHPPQARLLGRKLAAETPRHTQVFVATHSDDVLQGLLDDPKTNVTVMRMTRERTINHVAPLTASAVRELWRDPLLRYSQVLKGVFHRGVVLCESDADARFYSATLDAWRHGRALAAHDLLFVQTGGKQRFATVARALAAVQVPVAVVADFDLLREESTVSSLYSAMGGDWREMQDQWRRFAKAVNDIASNPSVTTVRERVLQLLDTHKGATIDRDLSGRLREVTRADDGWAQLKHGGFSAVPQGDAATIAESLSGALRGHGIFLVDVGELERWVPTVGGHGPAWVVRVLESDGHESAHLAQKFIDGVASYLEK